MKLNNKLLFRKFIAYFLFATVSLFITPTELIHELIHHDDTCDVMTHDKASHHVGELHQHCEMLQFSAPPFLNTENNFFFFSSTLISVQPVENTIGYQFSSSPFLFFRGPPSVV